MAGSFRRGPSPLTDKRAQYLRLMQQGTNNAEACRIVGVNRKTGTRWKHGRRYTNRVGETWVCLLASGVVLLGVGVGVARALDGTRRNTWSD